MSARLALALALLFALVRPAAAAPGLAPVVLSGERDTYDLNGHFEVAVDVDGALGLADVAQLPGERWKLVEGTHPSFGFSASTYWLRLRVHNPLDTRIESMLAFRYPLLDHVRAFVEKPGGGFVEQVSGDGLPVAVRHVKSRRIVFAVTSEAGQSQWIYLQVKTESSVLLGLELSSVSGFVSRQENDTLLRGGYFGIMIAVTLYNLFLWLATRSRTYLHYVLYMGLFSLVQMALDGTTYRYFFPSLPVVGNTFLPLVLTAAQSFPIFFTQAFLGTRESVPRLHRVLSAYAWFSIACLPVALFAPYGVSIRLAALLAMTTSLLCEIVGVVMLVRGARAARFYALAWTALILGTIAYGLVAYGVLPANAFFTNVQLAGSAIEAVLLSFALGDQIATIERERERARAEAVTLERDLALTGTVQQLFLPREASFTAPGLSLTGFYRPATRCGGDWWWYEQRPDGKLIVLVGDITGHGAGPAMMTAAVAATYRSAPDSLRHGDPGEILTSLHNSLRAICSGEYRMSGAAIEIDAARGTLEIWSAGSPALLVMRADGQVTPLAAKGSPMGGKQLVVGKLSHTLEKGDRILVFSDGLPELVLPTGKQLGYGRVKKLLGETRGSELDAARDQLFASLEEARAGESQHDDITFVLIDVQGEVRKASEAAA